MASTEAADDCILLAIRGLRTYFYTSRGILRVLDGLDLTVRRNQIMGLLGESGSGKSVTAYSVMRLVRYPGRVVGGQVIFEGTDLLRLTEKEMEQIRGRRISLISQNPRNCLNPLLPVGKQLTDVLHVRKALKGADLRSAAIEMLRRVALPDIERKMAAYPHELSTGMCQRVMIALALACEPQLLVADEATTGLDVTIQYQILQLLRQLSSSLNMTQIIITHDLGVAAEICDAITVMYAGSIVESAPTAELFDHPGHPYTLGLLASKPRLRFTGELKAIPGSVPDFLTPQPACRFQPRCSKAKDVCAQVTPPVVTTSPDHIVVCHFPEA